MPKHGVLNCGVAAALMAACVPGAMAAPTVAAIVNTFARAAVQNGSVPGLEIAVVIGAAKPVFFSYGVADTTAHTRPTKNTLFQIASVTKVFTTNLLGQAAYANTLPLGEPLADFSAQLGTLPAATAAVTLENLADFTGGFPTLAPNCTAGEKSAATGCLPTGNIRPTLTQYSGRDFAAFFRTYNIAGAAPQPYLYSDFSIGLLGLLLGAPPATGLANTALTGWQNLLKSALLKPLHLTATLLNVPPNLQARLAPGYETAQATASLSGGGIAGLTLTDPGGGYTSAPAVTVSGGGGSGAVVGARIDAARGSVTGLTVTSAGSGYIAAPTVTFSKGAASGTAIIRDGHIVGVQMQAGGSYTTAPTITFSGGRIGGHDATGTVFIDHDLVSYVQITDGGAGYADPLTVAIAPGAPNTLVVPIWAPAGALKSSAADLAAFTQAALGQTTVNGNAVPPAITAGFDLAETPYACKGASPELNGCTTGKSGLAWDIFTATPETVSKDGGLGGYSSFVILLPGSGTGVVVLANDYHNTGQAPAIGSAIAYALYHNGLLPHAPLPH